jgi:hypothetical protein
MSFSTSNNRKSWFTFSVVCVKMLLGKASTGMPLEQAQKEEVSGDSDGDDEDEDVIIGDVTLFNDTVKGRVGGKSEVVEHLETEAQRTAALQKWFSLTLNNAERDGIRNMLTALS